MRLFNNSVRWLREGYYDIRINTLYVGDMKHFYTQFKPGRQEGNIAYTLPTAQADGAKFLFNDGEGNLSWTDGDPGASVVWGAITGTISSQTDLQAALNAKEPTIAAGTTVQYWRGDKTWQTLNHATLPNLSFDDSGHTGFQKELVYDDILGCYLIG